MMKSGTKYRFGDVVLAFMQFTDSGEIKLRPAVVLFHELGNVICAGITSNPHMQGINIAKSEGMAIDSVIKMNYIMTLSEKVIKKFILSLPEEKKRLIRNEFMRRLA